jgi:Ribbon-helix-helix protein, copG family
MKRTNFYLTHRQMERLKERSEGEGLSLAELVRRAVDAFLAWDDPTYTPTPITSQKERRSHWP